MTSRHPDMPSDDTISRSERSLRCPMCGADATKRLFDSKNGYPILRCVECDLVYVDDRRAPSATKLYPAFDQRKTATLDRVRGALRVFLRQREAFIRHVKPPTSKAPAPRLLDFGCGAGAFAVHMSTRGYDVVGLEPHSLGEPPPPTESLRFVRTPLEQAGEQLGKFDVITMWHVLEHLHTPVDILRMLTQHLADDGVLVVSVPNFESLQSLVFKGGWFHLDPPRHVIQFESKTLRDCLHRVGLVVSDEQDFFPEYGSSGWLQSSLNTFLPRHNFLYEFVKDRGALKGVSAADSAFHLGASALAAAPLLTVGMALETAAMLTKNRGAALTVAARRAPR